MTIPARSSHLLNTATSNLTETWFKMAANGTPQWIVMNLADNQTLNLDLPLAA